MAGVAVAATVLVTAAWGSDSEPVAETRTVDTANGPVEIPAEPQAALGIYTADVNVLIALGYPFADAQAIRAEFETFPAYFSADAIDGVEPFDNYAEFNYEQIATAAPGFISNSLAYELETVTRLAEIAPTYSFNGFAGTPWREHCEETAHVLDRVEQYEEWTATYEERLVEVGDAIGERANDLVVAPVLFFEGQVMLACQAICSVFDDLGIEVVPGAFENSSGIALTVEEPGQLSGVGASASTKAPGATENAVSGLGDNSLWNSLPFVQ